MKCECCGQAVELNSDKSVTRHYIPKERELAIEECLIKCKKVLFDLPQEFDEARESIHDCMAEIRTLAEVKK